MTMNIGDLVMTPSGVARVTENPGRRVMTTRGAWDCKVLHLLTVPGAFGIAGHAVPEGRLCWADADEDHDPRWYNPHPTEPKSRVFLIDADQWGDWFTCKCEPDISPDLRRTPASDTWDTLPQVVREKVEEALKV